jgi:PAS domain S-box-containing protein
MNVERQAEIARSLFRESNDAFFVFDPADLRIVDLNPAALRMTGFSRKAALAMRVNDLFTSAEPDGMRRLIEAVEQTRFFHSREEYGLARLEGEPLSVNVSVSRVHTRPEPLGLVVVRDVTERRRAHEVLDQFFRHSPALFAILGPDGRFLRVNAAWAGALGYPAEELRAVSPADLVFPESAAELGGWDPSRPGAGGPTLEVRFRHKFDGDRWLSWSVATVDGTTYVVAQDVTERRRGEAFRQAKEAAEAANRAKTEFLANTSHEIRTPLTAILGFTDLLIHEQARPDRGAHADAHTIDRLRTIQRNGELLLGIVDDILDLSKIESDRIDVGLAECSPSEVVDDVIGLMRVRSQEKGLSLSVRADEAVPGTVRTDPLRLRQILFNLVGNAIKFTERGGVEVKIRPDRQENAEPAVSFDVTDTGIGMSPEEIAALFRPFSRAKTSRERGFGGTGLGLAISQRLARMLGGSIDLRSTPGAGSTFTLTIPAVPAGGGPHVDLSEKGPSARAAGRAAPARPAKLSGRILVAEDNTDNQRVIALRLGMAGLDVTLALNGRVAVDLALGARDRGRPFDVILMDMQMPVLDGYEATRQLRAEGVGTPIIALTAHAMADERAQCLRLGCDDFLSKPIDWENLLGIIASLVARASTSDPPSRHR